MVDVADDFDSLCEDESFLSAVAAAETQHMQQRSSNIRSGGDNYVGNVKRRKEEWEGESITYNRDQQYRGEFVTPGDKRRRTDDDRGYRGPTNSFASSDYAEYHNEAKSESQPEGEYMAALRGSNSEVWLKSASAKGSGGNTNPKGASGNVPEGAGAWGGGTGPCYKCGLEGHWARDCTNPKGVGGFSMQVGGPSREPPNVPEKICACGGGTCLVLTANTEKNLGRHFYRCPLKRNEGQCTFFEWCDAGGQIVAEKKTYSAVVRQEFPAMDCKCGAGPCVTLTAKTERNMGRAFYKCPAPKEQACGFFQWCDDAGKDNNRVSIPEFAGSRGYNPSRNADTLSASRGYNPSRSLDSPSGGPMGPCYKCGHFGHYARDCIAESSTGLGNCTPYASGTNREKGTSGGEIVPPTAGTCYKCGQGGHWAKDCPDQGGVGFQSHNSALTPEVKKSGTCYKCGDQGHWSTSCPKSGGGAGGTRVFSSSGSSSTGSCYKCGDTGHWADKCFRPPSGPR